MERFRCLNATTWTGSCVISAPGLKSTWTICTTPCHCKMDNNSTSSLRTILASTDATKQWGTFTSAMLTWRISLVKTEVKCTWARTSSALTAKRALKRYAANGEQQMISPTNKLSSFTHLEMKRTKLNSQLKMPAAASKSSCLSILRPLRSAPKLAPPKTSSL